jgi:hypothetical protein
MASYGREGRDEDGAEVLVTAWFFTSTIRGQMISLWIGEKILRLR